VCPRIPPTCPPAPSDASGTGLTGSYPLAADAPDTELAGPDDLLAADALFDPDLLTFGSPHADTLDPDLLAAGTPPTLSRRPRPARRQHFRLAPRQHIPPGAQRDLPPPRARRRPTLNGYSDGLPAGSQYKVEAWLLQQVQRDLARALHRIIQDNHLADKLYDNANGLGFAMLVLIEKFAITHMVGPQASLTNNFARAQILGTPLLYASSNCTTAPTRSTTSSRNTWRLPTSVRLCAPTPTILTTMFYLFLDRLPNKFGSELRNQIQMYKPSRRPQ